MYYNDDILNNLKLRIMVAKEIDPAFNVNNYMFVLGINIINDFASNLVIECKQGKLFGIKVCIDYNDKNSFKLYKEV